MSDLLQTIKDEIATDKFKWHSGWDQLSVEHKDELWSEVCKRYAAAERSNVIDHLTNMRNLMSFWDDEKREKLKYVESHIGLLNQLIEEIEKLPKL